MSHTAYSYRVVEVRKIVDGDTVDLVLDLGFYLSAALRFRLLNVDAPERGKPGAAEATAFVRAWLDDNAGSITASTRKADSFGRWLADLHNEDGDCLSTALIESGLVEMYAR